MNMPDKDDPISNSLGIEPMGPSAKITSVLPAVKAETNNDYEYARRNLYDLIEKGQDALDELIDIAKQSQQARAFEVATNLIKTMAETNKDLMNLAKVKKEVDGEAPRGPDKTVNNNLFVGSTSELLKMIKNNGNTTE
jgi:hypothetical protein